MSNGKGQTPRRAPEGGAVSEERILADVLDAMSDDEENIEVLYWEVNNRVAGFSGPSPQPNMKHPRECVTRTDIIRILKQCLAKGFAICQETKFDPRENQYYGEVTDAWDEHREGDFWFGLTPAGQRERDRLWEKLRLDELYGNED